MRKSIFTIIGAVMGLPLMLSTAHAVPTFVDTMGGHNGNERCLVGSGAFGNNTCTGGGTFGNQSSIVDLIINDINTTENLSLSWERITDPADNLFTFLSNGNTATSVQGRARYAGYSNKFGGTVDGDYTELLGTPLAKNTVLLGNDVGGFIPVDLGLTSGDAWKPTLVAGDGKIYTSDPLDNLNGLDHMVAFRTINPINDPDADGFAAFRYIIAFEDLPDLGDEDYNDYVVEINFAALQTTSVPEPAALSLFGLGIVGLGLMRRRRKTV